MWWRVECDYYHDLNEYKNMLVLKDGFPIHEGVYL